MPGKTVVGPGDGVTIMGPELAGIGLLDLFDLLRQIVFEKLLLVPICFVMTRTRDLEEKAHPFKILPPTLLVDLSPSLFSHPERDFSASPQSAIWSCLVGSL